MAGVVDRPRLVVECAFATNPFVALTDASVAWVPITDYLEVEKGVSIARRRANELDEPSSGTLSLWLDNSDGRFTRLNTSSPYYPYVKYNRLIRVRAQWPSSSVNLVTRRQATGGQDDVASAGFSAPSGTVTTSTATITAALAGSTTTFQCLDAVAAGIEIGDVVSLNPAKNSNAGFELGTGGWGPIGGTFTQANDQVYSGSWSGKLVPNGVAPSTFVASTWQPYTAGRTYEASAWVRCAVARSVNLQIHWYDATSTFITFSNASVAVPAGTWTQVTVSGVAPPNATQGPVLVSMGGTPPATNVLWVDEVSVREASAPTAFYAITGKSSAGGTTTFTFAPAAPAATAAGDEMTRSRTQWDTGLQAVTGTRLTAGTTGTMTAGPDAIAVTAGLPYTWSCWVERGATAISVSPRIGWYDLTGALISESVGSTTALTTSLQQLALTATAPAGAVLARVSAANETTFFGSPTIAYRAGTTAKGQSVNKLNVTVPAAVRAGDGMLMWVSVSNQPSTVPTPAGWTYVNDRISGTSPWQSRTYLFKKVATSTDAGSTVTLTQSVFARFVAILEAYSGTDTADCVHQQNSAIETSTTTSHTTPNVTTTLANCWIVSACFDRSNTTTAWTAPDTKRHDVFTTGSPASTGSVADNAAPVAAGTYGGKVFTSNSASDNASMWTVALKPQPISGASSGTVLVAGAQFEQAAAASAWAYPAATYTRFVGHVDSWPTQWDGGVWAVCNVTATDRSKLLNDDTVSSALTEEVLFDDPLAYYPLAEDGDATAAGNAADTAQPSLPIVSAGSVTDDMLSFGGGTGPGTDAQSALLLTPSSATVGKALRGPLNTPLGGDGVTEMTIAGWFNTTVTGSSTRVICGADDGKPTDGGAAALFDIGLNQAGPFLRAHLKMPGASSEVICDQATSYADGKTHMVAATAAISGGTITVRLYLDGVLKQTASTSTSVSDFTELNRFNVGCGAFDTIGFLWSGTLSHCMAWNRALAAADVLDLFTAGSTGFAGDSPGARASRIAAWKGLASTAFEAGTPTTLASHPAGETSLLEAFKLVARSDGGLFFVDRAGVATLHAHGHRTGAVSLWSITADQLEASLIWNEDPTLIANDVTVQWGAGDSTVRATDQASISDYGRQTAQLDTILADDTQAADRASAYLTRYREPISRPGDAAIEALTLPALWDELLGSEIGQKFSVTGLPAGAPAANVDLFIEGVGEDITHDSWKFSLDCSPAGFDFGLLLDDPVRGLLDSNYVGW